MVALLSAPTISEAWLAAVRAAVHAPGGRSLHSVVSVAHPGPPEPELVRVIDDLLDDRRQHSVSTVASTLFPSNLYADPGVHWHPDMSRVDQQRLDLAAEDLYETYCTALPVLLGADGNHHGTYFGRLVSWPGKNGDGYNQLAVRIRQLRAQRRKGNAVTNAADIVVDGPAELATEVANGKDATPGTLQIYHSHDERTRAFPCLVHIDISVLDNQLSVLAVYRHWHLITKALGNLIGLSRLQYFLAQQTGYDVGELVVHGTVVAAQFGQFGMGRVRRLADEAAALLSSAEVPADPEPSVSGVP